MRRFLLLTCCLALAIAAPPAAAAKKHKKPKGLGPVVTATAAGPTATTPGASSTATATCPAGHQAVGGGFSAPFTPTGALVVTQSYRSSRDSWRVSAVVVSGAGAATAYAYCRRMTVPVADVTATGTLASGPGESKLVEADCGPKAVAISGGFQMTSGPVPAHLPIPEQSIGGGPARGGTPPVGHWDVVAQNSSTGAQTITAHVYCATGLVRPAFRQDHGFATVPVFGSLTETSVCPPSRKARRKKLKRPKRALSAGAFYSPFIPGTAVLPVHTDSRIAGGAFIDTAVNGGSGTGTLDVQTRAMCF
ncbi:MAG TPA: hypothetical protein VHU24_05205 [Solirubrobacterales bacterium]|nr:hypothetical protein [Solirubrobacterales bacterium]